jgi:hypothetical protein
MFDLSFRLLHSPHIVKRSRGWSWYDRKAVDIEKSISSAFLFIKVPFRTDFR